MPLAAVAWASTSVAALPQRAPADVLQAASDGHAAIMLQSSGSSSTHYDYTMIWSGPSTEQTKLRGMWWAHVPKTSTTFSRTVFSYACGAQADDFAAVQTTRPPYVNNGTCLGALSPLQQGPVEQMRRMHPDHDATWYHMPLPQVGGPGTGPEPSVSAIMLFRKPEDRLRSAVNMIESCPHPCTCCAANAGINAQDYEANGWYIGDDWGWTKRMKRETWMTARGLKEVGTHETPYVFKPPDMTDDWEVVGEASSYALAPGLNSTFARQNATLNTLGGVHGLHGCQTKFVLGLGCHESHELTAEEVELAVHYVSEDAAFVGIMERYAESVCLFHSMHGGPLYDFELKGLDLERLAEPTEDPWAARFDGDDQLATLATDAADDAVYEAALTRFESLLATHKADVDECTKQVALAKERLKPEKGKSLMLLVD